MTGVTSWRCPDGLAKRHERHDAVSGSVRQKIFEAGAQKDLLRESCVTIDAASDVSGVTATDSE